MSVNTIIDIWVTGNCNMNCPFCYGADPPVKLKRGSCDFTNNIPLYQPTPETIKITNSSMLRPEMTFDQLKELIESLKRVGITTVTISGGEPLIRKDTSKLIKFISDMGMRVYLSTNGSYLLEKYEKIKDYIYALGLPLDGSNDYYNRQMGRSSNHFNNIIKILQYFNSNEPSHIVRIGTIVSKVNKNDIEAIGDFLYKKNDIYSPDVWRLYQFETLKKGANQEKVFGITEDEFHNICKPIRDKFHNSKISIRSKSDHEDSYFFITPDGILQKVYDKHVSIVDLLKVSSQELECYFNQNIQTIERTNNNRRWLKG